MKFMLFPNGIYIYSYVENIKYDFPQHKKEKIFLRKQSRKVCRSFWNNDRLLLREEQSRQLRVEWQLLHGKLVPVKKRAISLC